MTCVYRHPKIKALLSLTRGEGFGLPIFESAYNALPIVAPTFSGQNDFIFMPLRDKKKNKIIQACMIANVSYDIQTVGQDAVQSSIIHRDGQVWDTMILPDSQWCEPRELSAKSQMRDVHRNYGVHKNKALKLQSYVLDKFKEDKMYAKFVDAICEDFNVINIADYLKEENPNLSEIVEYN